MRHAIRESRTVFNCVALVLFAAAVAMPTLAEAQDLAKFEERMTEFTLDNGLKFLVLKQLDIEGKETGGYRVAADAVGAGLGEVVLYATGSAARQTRYTHERPCDGVILAIVDILEVDGDVKYDKAEVG